MKNKKILWIAFILVALFQLLVPAKMIWDREDILETGVEFKFKTSPIDPNDPFIGKYIILNFDENTVVAPSGHEWKRGEAIYVFLITDNNGFVKIKTISRTRPTQNQDYIKANVGFVSGNGSAMVTIDYPFDRFYMEESKAFEAEQAYLQFQRDTSKTTYALVNIRNGEAVLKDVMIDGISIKEIVKSNQLDNKD